MQPSSLPLTLTLSLKGRGVFIVFLLVLCSVMLGASLVSAETWRCTKPDGSVVYSDQNLSGECRKLEALPPLLRVPSVPPVHRHLYRHDPAAALSDSGGGQGGLRQVDEMRGR